MQGVEIEDEGSVLKYMTKSEIEEQHSSLLIMTQRLFSSFNQHDIGITCVTCLPILFPTLVILFPTLVILLPRHGIFFGNNIAVDPNIVKNFRQRI